MKLAETVTFGGSGLDRAAELRRDPAELDRLAATPEARTLLLWRGMILAAPDGSALTRLPEESKVLSGTTDERIFVGRDEAGPVFAKELAPWEPDLPEDAPKPAPFSSVSVAHPDAPDGAEFHDLRAIMTALTPREAELAATAKALFGWHASHGFCSVCGQPSEMVDGGWQRRCPDCGGHHFPRTDPVVIMLVVKGNSVLLGRSPGWPDGMFSLLAGFIEPGETIEAAVRREVFEETRVRVGKVNYLASQPWPFPASLMLGCIGEAESTEIEVDPVEIEQATWVSRERMLDVFAGTDPVIRAPRGGAIAAFLLRYWLADRLD
ncbi:NAD(+) diphosphatase [Pelagovum pacificum]|uniref:NAD(+) diphosphatase n=1 Tax=Pelagovum pacificum TaxID=2588711 RepID=A0A5C5GAJ7_9RHOB|nr:NAD(+) diphosphatase [Pelagovum pacificum]QQA42499.1 NAD(+) diphosphatase [Pelagovum pacificum]TNY31583.1 NAD(+) diphosphatase [Pelagovum pacificum]